MEPGVKVAQDGGVLPEVTDFCRLFLFRHPELDEIQRQRAVGSGDAALSRRGRAQALQWVAWLDGEKVDAVWSSPQLQCREPAQVLAQRHELAVQTDPRLRDQEMGRWQGRAWEEVAQQEGDAVRTFFTEFGEAVAPGGESLGVAVERMLEWWTATAPGQAGRGLVLVLPGSLISGFCAAMLGMRLSRCMSLNLPHGSLGVLDAFQNGVRLSAWNVAALRD